MSAMEKNYNMSSTSKIVLEIDAFPFKDLKISEDWQKLESVENRTICSVCKKSRKYFCYTCYVPVPEIQHFVPKVKLPVKVDIIKHAREMDGKSTAVHAAVLAPEDVRIFTYPCIPDYDPYENVVLIFPNKDAVSVEEVCERFFRKVHSQPSKRLCQESRRCVIHRAVFIDSTWNQSRGIFKDSRIRALPSVVLKTRLSQFWRHQADSPRWYLATIEAIHQFLVEMDAAQWELNHRTAFELVKEPADWQQGETITSENESRIKCSEVTTYNSNIETVSDTGDKSLSSQKEIKENNNIPVCISEKEAHSYSDNKTKFNSVKCEKYSYSGKYDNLLFFFRFMYSKIHTLYDHDQLRSYKRRLE